MKQKILKKSVLILSVVVFTLMLFFNTASVSAFENCDNRDGYTVNDIKEIISNYNQVEVYSEDGTMEIMEEPMNIPVEDYSVDLNDARTSTSFEEVKIVDSGKPDSESIVVTIMGDGFTANEQNKFINAANKAVNYLIGNDSTGDKGFYPYNLFKDYFTIYAIKVISEESGVSRDADTNNGHIVNNYFGSSFYYGNDYSDIKRALVITKENKARALKKSGSSMTAIMCNSTRWGGTGGEFAVISMHNNCGRILTHEFGHSFGELADEYWYEDETFRPFEAVNKTRNGNLNTIKWKHWIGKSGIYSGIGAYRFSDDSSFTAYNWYKPHQNCQMQYTEAPFCAVCAEELIKRMEQKTGSLFDTTSISNTEIKIDKVNYTLYDSFEIPPVIDGKNVLFIGQNAFENQFNLTSITIPSCVINIDSGAFKNCSSLTSVKVEKETYDITNLGSNVFESCSSALQIKVPQNRLAEYKNKDNWVNYKNKIIADNYDFEEINLHCFSDGLKDVSINAGYNKLIKLNVECPKTYKFITNLDAEMFIYDSDFDEIDFGDDTLYVYLNIGTYYLDVRHSLNNISSTISIEYGVRWEHEGEQLYYNQSLNLLTHLHETEDTYLNKLYYINDRGAGFYKFSISGFDNYEDLVIFGDESLIIYNNSDRLESQMLYKCPDSSQTASLVEGQNIIYVYLPRNGYYYINIIMPSNIYESLNLAISSIELQEINLFDLNEDGNSIVSITNSSNKYDYVKKISIEQSGEFTISYRYQGNVSNDFEVFLAKQNYNSSTGVYTFETLILELMNVCNNSYTYTGVLETGNYYIGYFNKKDYSKFVIDLERHVTLSGEEVLVTDPDRFTLCGSQINIVEMNESTKSYRGIEITKNFTRIIYPNYNYGISPSRLDYYWYSSNENVAEVTEYGTVLGKTIGNVKIMAVLKSDPSKVFIKTFDIVDDTGTETLVARSTIEVKLSEIENGGFQLPLEKANCPFPMFQYYNWTLDKTCDGNYSTTYDQWGVFSANGIGCFTLIGRYQRNTRITVIIHVIIVAG